MINRFPPKLKSAHVAPNPVGATLTEQQIEQIASTFYVRFIHKENLPDWKSAFADNIRKSTIHMVKGIVDSMVINNYEIHQLGTTIDEES